MAELQSVLCKLTSLELHDWGRAGMVGGSLPLDNESCFEFKFIPYFEVKLATLVTLERSLKSASDFTWW